MKIFKCCFFLKLQVRIFFLSRYFVIMGHTRWSIFSFDPVTSASGHSRSYEVNFLPVIFDRTEIERCEWSQCVSLAKMHQLICNMTYLTQHITSGDLDLMSNSDIDIFRSTCTSFEAFWWEEYDGAKIMSLALFAKNHFFAKIVLFWHFLISLA